MQLILSSRGNPIYVDDVDYHRVAAHSWSEFPGKGKTYLHAVVGGRLVLIQRFVLLITDPEIVVDHKSGDTFDNRRDNLRPCTQSQNAKNRKTNHTSTTGLKGVSPTGDRYRARIWTTEGRVHLGSFETAEEAHAAYITAANEHHGEFARVA